MASRKRKTSILWDHFAEVDSQKAKCKYCSQIIAFTSGSLGNLSRHVKRRHAGISLSPVERQAVLTPNENDPRPPPSETEVVLNDTPAVSLPEPQASNSRQVQQKIYAFTESTRPLSQQKKAKIDNQLITMIAKEYHPLRLVEEKEFGKFVALLCPSYRLPTRKTLSEKLLPQLCLKLEEEVHLKLENVPAICLTTDAWTSINNSSFIAVTAHYIDVKNAKLCSNLLGCIEFGERHTSVNICNFLKEQISKWKLEHKVGAVVSDNASNVIAAVQLGNWRSIGCFAHSLNLTVQAGLEEIAGYVHKVKSIVEFFKRSTQGLYKLQEIQRQMDLPVLKLKQDVPTRWNSTFDMLNRLLKVKNAVIATLALVKNELSLSKEDWVVIEKVVPILQIFDDVTVEISSEKNVTLSKVIVFCRILKRQMTQYLNELDKHSLSVENDTPSCVRKLLMTINEQCQKRFNNLEKNCLYAESTILDPRFKSKGFREEQNFKTAFDSLKHKVASMAQTKTTQPTRTASASAVEEVLPSTSSAAEDKRRRFWDVFDSEMESLVPQNTTAAGIVELNQYLNEPLLNRSGDPLLWWDARKNVYPILYRYMLKRLNLVATSVPCERIFSKAGLIQTDRRSRLSAKKVSQLLFISCNLQD